MIMFQEEKPKQDSVKALQRIAGIFWKISCLLGQVERKMLVIGFSENFFKEGTPADREFVRRKIMELQSLISELDEIELTLGQEDFQTPFAEKQSALNRATISLRPIRQTMLEIWGMRNSGENEDDNILIERIIRRMFISVNLVIHRIEDYVEEFNQASPQKLRFRVNWTPLPK